MVCHLTDRTCEQSHLTLLTLPLCQAKNFSNYPRTLALSKGPCVNSVGWINSIQRYWTILRTTSEDVYKRQPFRPAKPRFISSIVILKRVTTYSLVFLRNHIIFYEAPSIPGTAFSFQSTVCVSFVFTMFLINKLLKEAHSIRNLPFETEHYVTYFLYYVHTICMFVCHCICVWIEFYITNWDYYA